MRTNIPNNKVGRIIVKIVQIQCFLCNKSILHNKAWALILNLDFFSFMMNAVWISFLQTKVYVSNINRILRKQYDPVFWRFFFSNVTVFWRIFQKSSPYIFHNQNKLNHFFCCCCHFTKKNITFRRANIILLF